MEHVAGELTEGAVRVDEAKDQGRVRGVRRQPGQAHAVQLLPQHHDPDRRAGVLDISGWELSAISSIPEVYDCPFCKLCKHMKHI